MADTLAFIDPDGTEYILTQQVNRDVRWGEGVQGRFMPPVSFIEDEIPEQPGSRLRRVKINPREIAVSLSFMGADATALRALLRSYLSVFNPSRGNGKLRATAPDGSQREITCRYVGGMEIEETRDTTDWLRFQLAVAVFRAFDPYWYEVASNSFTFVTGTAATFFPFFPIRLSSSEVFADTTINNTGDAEAWPVWTITGPGSNLVLRNLTTGKLLSLTGSIAAGEVITIDTTPGIKSVKNASGANLFSSLSSASSLWPLAVGSNSVRIEMGSSTAASAVSLVYRRRFLGA